MSNALINKVIKLQCPVLYARVLEATESSYSTPKDPLFQRNISLVLTPEQKEHLLKEGLTEMVNNPELGTMVSRFKDSTTASDSLAAALEATGVKDGVVLPVKNSYNSEEMGKLKAIPVVGRDGKTEFTDAIGNGSICNVHIRLKQQKMKSGRGGPVHPRIAGVQVVEHVAYNPDATNLSFDTLPETEASADIGIVEGDF